MINNVPFQYHNYPKLMSGTCHLQYRSKLGLLRVIAWLALECIWADRIDGRKTQRSVIGDALLLIYYHKVLWPPWIKICCWNLKKVKKKGTGDGKRGEGGNLLTDIKWDFKPGCLRGEVTKLGCVKVRHVHSKWECQVKLIREPWPLRCIFTYSSPQAPWAALKKGERL